MRTKHSSFFYCYGLIYSEVSQIWKRVNFFRWSWSLNSLTERLALESGSHRPIKKLYHQFFICHSSYWRWDYVINGLKCYGCASTSTSAKNFELVDKMLSFRRHTKTQNDFVCLFFFFKWMSCRLKVIFLLFEKRLSFAIMNIKKGKRKREYVWILFNKSRALKIHPFVIPF